MPFGKKYRRIAGDSHRLQLLLLICSLRIVDIVEFRNLLLNTGLHI